MALRETRSRGADHYGTRQHPQRVVRPRNQDEIAKILADARAHPSPVRSVGADYSLTRCASSDAGTSLNTGALDKILDFDDGCVRVQAGVRVGTLVRALAERGLELPLTPEVGNMSVGALAVTTLPQASYQEGLAQMASCVTEMKLITPQGRQITVTERDRDLMRVLRSSHGLLGVVHEVVLRIETLKPVKIDYQNYSLAEFALRYAKILAQPAALRLHIAPFSERVTVERRIVDHEASVSRSGIWQIRNSVMRNVLPAFGTSVGSVLATPGLRAAVLTGVHRALNATQSRASRGVVMHAHEWMRDLPSEAWKARHTYSVWAFAQADFPSLLQSYSAFCRAYYKKYRYRCHLVTGASRLHRDRNSLFSPSHAGDMVTLEPSSTGEQGFEDFLIDFNEFASAAGGKPTFNQTRALTTEHVSKAFGERARLFGALRRRTDPLNRLRNSYFAQLLD
ncbi:MAG: FAD-binding oxidoreductase [Steroidobacteraceae bacterium]|nr:FAD-binding oxidoreductase [Steroidobacteraceae bacterium]